ncbi:hypothetical protein JCGZ_15718 [Jatropha curcas]|uniref:Uncharacterized protein n=2 Tax=Jatropha curcas TaxID=180498 RepID=A0A067KYN9_JATCU|nr:hypothetical protein JCGZ_15718 [Jatropha curcas]
MGLKDGNGSHKQSNLNVEDAERNGISNSNSTKENTKHDDGVVGSGPQNGENLKKNEDNLPAKEKLYKDGKEDDDLDDSQSSSFGSSLSLKVPSSDDDYPLSSPSSSSTTFSLRKDVLQKHNNIQQGFNKRKNNNNVAFAAVEDREDKASQSKSSISVESETSSLESLTFPVSDLKAVMKSPPPLQLMDKAGAGYDPQRIPSNVFEASVSMATVDWSAASNESLFSLQIGTSFARERIPLGENKHGVSSRISIAETGNRPSVNTEKEKKNKSIKIGKVNEAADENAITKANEEEEDQKEDIAIANNKEDKKQKNKTTLVKWKSTTVPKKPDATGISEDSAGSQV